MRAGERNVISFTGTSKKTWSKMLRIQKKKKNVLLVETNYYSNLLQNSTGVCFWQCARKQVIKK